MPTPHLIVMLTHNDHTVANAREIYLQNRHSQARFWGFKEEPLSRQEMKDLFALMKADGKTTFLEVVEYTEEAGLAGAGGRGEVVDGGGVDGKCGADMGLCFIDCSKGRRVDYGVGLEALNHIANGFGIGNIQGCRISGNQFPIFRQAVAEAARQLSF